MTDELFFDGARYISAADAAAISNLTRDYIARLAREGKVVGKQIGRGWYVSQESLRTFLVAQEYANAQRRGSLVRERQQEYGRVQASAAPKSVSAPKPSVLPAIAIAAASGENLELHRKLANAVAHGSAQAVSKVSAVASNAAGQVPLYAVSPGLELLHKVAAAVLAITLVVGVYGVGNSLAASSPENPAGTAVSPQVELGAAAGLLQNMFSGVASTMSRGVDALLAPFFGARFATSNAPQATVAIQIAQKPPVAPSTALAVQTQPKTTQPKTQPAQPATGSTTIVNPVVERIVQTENVVSSGGITESELDQKLQELDNSLSEKIYSAAAANSTTIAQNYNVTAQTNAIDQLTNTTITSPSIAGGSIKDASISGGTISGAKISGATFSGTTTLDALAVSGSATSTFGGGINLAGGCVAINGTCIGTGGAGNPGGSNTEVQYNDHGTFNGSSNFTFSKVSGTLSVLNASTSNATSTNSFATTASSTNLFAQHASFGDLSLVSALPVNSGGTGTTSAPSYGQVLVGNGAGGYSLVATSSLGIAGTSGGGGTSNVSTSSRNTWSALQLFAAGASTTNLSVFKNAYFGGTATSSFNSAGQLTLAGLSNSLLSTNGSGKVVATTTISTNLLNGTLGSVNGVSLSRGGSITVNAASSTLLANNNTFSGNNTFNNIITGSVSGNAGTVTNGVYTTTFGGLFNTAFGGKTTSDLAEGSNLYFTSARATANFVTNLAATTSVGSITALPHLSLPYSQLTGTPSFDTFAYLFPGDATSTSIAFNGGLTGNLTGNVTGALTGNADTATKLQTARTINGVSFDGTSNIVITAASSTLLANNNTFSGANTFTGKTTLGNASTTMLSVSGNSYLGTTRVNVLSLGSLSSCTGGEALQTNSNGTVTCGLIATGGASSGGGWTTNEIGSVTLSTSTDRVGIGATTTPYAKLSIVGSNAATTTLALVPASAQTANIIDIYNTSGGLGSVFTAGGYLGVGTTTPGSILSINGVGNFVANATSTLYHGLNVTGGCVAVNGTCLGSSSLSLSGNNSWTGLQTFAKASSTLTTLGTTWLSGITSSLLKTDSSGKLVAAVAGTDYQAPITAGTGLSFSGTTLNSPWTISGSNVSNNNAGNIGIGTSSPTALLTLRQSSDASLGSDGASSLRIYNTSGNSFGQLQVNTSGVELSSSGASPLPLYLNTNRAANPTLTLATDNNVGFGSTTPAEKLSVEGNGLIHGNLNASGAITFGSLTSGLVQSSASGALSNIATSSLGLPKFSDLSAAVAAAYEFPSNATSTKLTFSSGLLSLASTTIGAGGARGLTVNGNSTTTGNLIVQGGTSIGDFNVDNTVTCGNQYHTFIGPMGTVGGDECAALNVTQQDANNNVIYRFGAANAAWAGEFFANSTLVGLNTKTSVPIEFLINGSEKARVDSTGNFGIGTTSPSQKLSVAGNALISGSVNAGAITGTSFTGAGTGLTGTASSLSIGGNASTATKLANVRTINGVSFDGTGDITVNAASSTLLANNNTFSGNNTFSNTITGSISGNAGTAMKLQTARTIAGVSFDGTADISLNNNAITNGAGYITSAGATTNFITNLAATTSVASITTLPNLSLPWGQVSGAPAFDTFAYLFPGNATSTKLTFSGGLLSLASTTIGNGTATGGLTVNGGATTTSNAYFGGKLTATGAIAFTGLGSGFVGSRSGTLYNIASSSLNLPNTALQNSSITVNGTSFALGSSHTITAASSTLLTNNNTFSGSNTFSQTINGSVSGNAGTVTNGVYTTTFNGLFDNRLSASSSISGITTLPNLSLPSSQVTGLFAYLFPSNSTSTKITFSGGLLSLASTTIGNGTATGGLTVNGGATTTGNTYVAGDTTLNGNVAIGGTALDQNILLNVNRNTNDPSAATYGGLFQRNLVMTANNSQQIIGGGFTADTVTNAFNQTGYLKGGTFSALNQVAATASHVYGGEFLTYNVAAGTATDARAGNFLIQNANASGHITNAYGAYASLNLNGGTIANTYGFYVGNLTLGTQTNKPYSFYASDSNAYNYFAGNVGVGTTTPGSILSINGVGNFVANATSTLYHGLNVTGGCVAVNGTCLGTSNLSLSGNNSWTGLQTFAKASSTLTTLGTTWLSGITSSLLKTDSSGKLVAAVAGTDYVAPSGLTSAIASAYEFPGNATSTKIAFNGGLSTTYASTTQIGSTGNAYFATNGGKVGIGTTSPVALFNIAAKSGSTYPNNSLFAISSSTGGTSATLFSVDNTGLTTVGSAGGSGDATFQFGSDQNAWAMGYRSTDKSFEIASSTSLGANVALAINKSTLNVGIGTSSPTARLDVSAGSSGAAGPAGGTVLNVENSGDAYISLEAPATAQEGILFAQPGANGSGEVDYDQSTNKLSLWTNSASRLTIDSSGHVGIGTTTPGSILSVNGVGNFVSGATSTLYHGLNVTGGCVSVNGTCLGTSNLSLSSFSGSGVISYNNSTGAIGTQPGTFGGSGSYTFPGDILFHNATTTGNIVPAANNTYALGSPNYEWKDVYIGPGSLYVNGEEVVHTDPSQNVIVSANNNENLELYGTGSSNIILNPSGTGNVQLQGPTQITGGDAFTTTNGSAVLFTNGTAPGNLKLTGNEIQATNTNGGISLTPAGNGGVYVTAGDLGVGTTSPSNKLEVNGSSYFGGAVRVTGLLTAAHASSTQTTLGTTWLTGITSSLLKADSNGKLAAAVAGTDYAPATSGTGLLYGSGSGGFSSASVSTATGISFSGGTLSLASIPNSSLANSSITVNGQSVSLGGSVTLGSASSTLLADNNTFSGNDTFNNTITGSVSGNAGTVTNGVYTTTFNSLFDPRFITDLTATTTLPKITTLANLASVGALTSGSIGSGFGNINIGSNTFTGAGTGLTGTASSLTAGHVTTDANLTGAITSVGNTASLGSFTSANLATALTNETGSGSAVFATSPTLVTPNLGTPSTLVGTNITGTAASFNIGGNAGTATKLATARTINGVSFDGTGNITVTAASSTLLANNNTFSGTNIFTYPLSLTSTTGTTTIASGQGLAIGGTKFVLQGTNGNIGVNATPISNYKLGVVGNVGVAGVFTLMASTGNALGYGDTGKFAFTDGTGNLNYTTGGSGTQNNVTFNQGGKFGIGTTSPTALLDVSAGGSGAAGPAGGTVLNVENSGNDFISLEAPATAQEGILFAQPSANGSGEILYDQSTNKLALWTNSASRLTIDSSGHVGIGVSSPATNLDVNGGIRANGNIVAYNTGVEGGQFVLGWAGTSPTGQANSTWNIDDGPSDVFRIFRENAAGSALTAISIATSTGNATFGGSITAPLLTVSGSGSSQSVSITGNSSNTGSAYINTQITGTQTTANTNNYYGLNVNPNFTDATKGDVLSGLVGAQFNPQNSGAGIVNSLYSLYSVPLNSGTGTTTTMYAVIGDPENTGTGTTTTEVGLYAGGGNTNTKGLVSNYYGAYLSAPSKTGTISNEWGLYQADASANNYFAGNVGIGTGASSPTYALDIDSTTFKALRLTNSNSFGSEQELLDGSIQTSGNTFASIVFANREGHGPTSPDMGSSSISALYGGSANTSALSFSTSNGSTLAEAMRITSNGNVGIGTTTPGSLLSVGNTGGINFSTGTSTFSTTGGINLKSGCFAVKGTCIGSGSSFGYPFPSNATSTLLKFNAGVNVAAGQSYEYNGVQIITASTTLYNYFIGGAGNLTMTGAENLANGYEALSADTSGYGNMANGTLSLTSNTTGNANIANGTGTLYHNITGSSNIAIGYNALFNNSSATSSIAEGYSAASGVTAYHNQGGTSIGYQSGYHFATGSDYNTLLGYQSGYGITSGSKNIQIGSWTTTANANLTTGSNNIIIGNDIKAPGATASNQLNIGNLIFGTGLSGTGTTIAGSIGVGTTTPWAKLSVTGPDTTGGWAFAVADSSNAPIFSVQDNGVFNFGKNSTTTIKNNSAYAWTIATSTSASPLFAITTTSGSEQVSIGTPGSDVVLGDANSSPNFVFYNNGTIKGASSGKTITIGAGGDIVDFGVSTYINATSNPISTAMTPMLGIVAGNGNTGINIETDGTHAGINTWVPESAGGTAMNFVSGTSPSEVGSITETGTATAFNTTSDRRLKTDISTTTEGLSTLMEIPIFNFAFKSDPTKTIEQGFIAQTLESIYPEAVTTNGDNGVVPLGTSTIPWQVDYGRITPLLVESVQNIDDVFSATGATTSAPSILSTYQGTTTAIVIDKFGDLSIGTSTATTTTHQKFCLNGECETELPFYTSATSSTNSTPSLASDFVSAIEHVLTQWFASATDGIGNFFASIIHANEVDTQELCVTDSGGKTCVTRSQLDSLLAGAGASAGSASASSSDSTSTLAVLQINGNNPATVQVGSTYTDLGAKITGPTADLNLGIKASVDGATSTAMSAISIDTSVPGMHTIEYIVVDQQGATSTAQRIVNVVGSVSNGGAATSTPTSTASSTPSTNSTSSDSSSASSTPATKTSDATSTQTTVTSTSTAATSTTP